jgi:redox-sensitive bicupin YhaK (pirin superfamily)
MKTLRRSQDRGHTRLSWLDSAHSFSFGDYYDPEQNGFGALVVINDDHVAPGRGFGMHPHRDMEIVTVVLSGALEHRDSLGNGSVIRPGEVQRMTAGTGIRHSEYNPSPSDPVHLYQIWLLPERRGLTPGYEQKSLDPEAARGRWQLLASRDGRDGSVTIHQDAELHRAVLTAGGVLDYRLTPGRRAWLQVLRSQATVDGTRLATGDGLALADEPGLSVHAEEETDILLFDLA